MHPKESSPENGAQLEENKTRGISYCMEGKYFYLQKSSKKKSFFFITIIDRCLKYKNKEMPKTGPMPRPHLNYDVKIGPKLGPRGLKKSGPHRAWAEMQGSILNSAESTLGM